MIVDELGRIPMSPYLTATLTRAADYATAQAHREVTLEHLLLALTEDPEATIVLKSSRIDLARLSADVSDVLGHSDDRIDPSTGHAIVVSSDLRRILEAAAAAARQGRRREINGAIVLAAIVGDGQSTAAHLLREQGLTFEAAIRALQQVATKPSPSPSLPAPAPPSPAPAHPQQPAAPPAHYQPAPSPPQHQQLPAPQPVQAPPVTERTGPPKPDAMRPAATTEEILASARERLGTPPPVAVPVPQQPAPPVQYPRANYPDRTAPLEPQAPDSAPQAEHDDFASFGNERPGGRYGHADPAPYATPAPYDEHRLDHRDAPPPSPAPSAAGERRRASTSSGPFVGSWPLIETGQLVENVPRRMRVDVPVVVEARIARADVKALAEGLAGGGAAFRHEVVVTKAMSVRLRAPDGGFQIENRAPETQWIENVLGIGSDDFASWRWTVTPRSSGSRQLQLIVSARTVGADGVTAETALPDQVIEVKVAINYARTAARWGGWIAAAIVGGLLAKFGEIGFVVVKLLAAKHLGL